MEKPICLPLGTCLNVYMKHPKYTHTQFALKNHDQQL